MTDQAKPAAPADGNQTDLDAQFQRLAERSSERLFGDTAKALELARESRQPLEATRKSDDEDDRDSEATVDDPIPSTTTSFWSNPLLRAAQLNSIALRCKGAISYVRSKWGLLSRSTQTRTHARQEEQIRAPRNVSAAEGTGDHVGGIAARRTEASLERAQIQGGGSGEMAATHPGNDSIGAAVPKNVRSLPPQEAQAGTSVCQTPGKRPQVGRDEHSAASSSCPTCPEVLHSQHKTLLKAHDTPSRETTDASAVQTSKRREETEPPAEVTLEWVEKMVAARERTIRDRLSDGALSMPVTGTGKPRPVSLGPTLCEVLGSMRGKIPVPSILLNSQVNNFEHITSMLDNQDARSVRDLFNLTKAHNELRIGDAGYDNVFGSGWREPGGIKGLPSHVAQAILEDAGLEGPVDPRTWLPELTQYTCRPDAQTTWMHNMSNFIEGRRGFHAARKLIQTVLKYDASTADTKPDLGATTTPVHRTEQKLPERLPPWRPSMYSARRHTWAQLEKKSALHWMQRVKREQSRPSAQLLTTLQALEAEPEYILENAKVAESIYKLQSEIFEPVMSKHQVTSLEEGRSEAMRKQTAVWTKAFQEAGRLFYGKEATEQKEEGVKRLEEHMKRQPLELTVTQLNTKTGDKAAYAWNEDVQSVTAQLAHSAIEWNFERAGLYTFALHDQDDFSRAQLRNVLSELSSFEERVGKLGQIRAGREERARRITKAPPASGPIDSTGLLETNQTQEATQEKREEEKPAIAATTEAAKPAPAPPTTAGTGWEPNKEELSFLNPVKDAKDRIGQALEEVNQLDREFASRLAPLRTKLEGYEALQSEPLITQTKSQILSLLDTWSTYSKYDRSRPHLQEFSETDHEAWTDFFSRSKTAFKDRCALTPGMRDLVKEAPKGLSALSMREVEKANSVPFDKAADAYTPEESSVAKRLSEGRSLTSDEQIIWTSWESKRSRRKLAEAASQANQTTKEDNITEKTDTSQVNPEPSDVTQSQTSEKPLTTSIAEASDVSDHALSDTTPTSAT